MNNNFIIGIFSGFIFSIFLLGSIFNFGFSSFCVSSPPLETTKNTGCRLYMNQNPVCGNWSSFNVTWHGVSKYFSEFIVDDYKCTDEACARIACSCPDLSNQ